MSVDLGLDLGLEAVENRERRRYERRFALALRALVVRGEGELRAERREARRREFDAAAIAETLAEFDVWRSSRCRRTPITGATRPVEP